MTRTADGGKPGDLLATEDTDPSRPSAIREAHAEHEAQRRAEAASAPTLAQSSLRSRPQTFQPGDLVAGRYRIVRFVAQGGMGQVYEAEDLELRERVALKTVRSEVAEHPNAIERFKREIYLARRVTHPNVCRMFDVGFHPIAGGKITFLTMELLEGETLAARLRRTGRMKPAEALPIVKQMAEALAAAHQAGIVHRDFKSENVLLSGDRAVITDFGLARAAAVDQASALALTGVGGIVGSPGYMAPEQVEGGEVRAAADVYALGVVMYEMITGHLPFVGETPLATAVKRLKGPPRPPRALVPDLDDRWNAAILRCLERDPKDRLASAIDVVRLLGGDPVALPRKRRRLALPALVAVGVLAAVGAGFLMRSAWQSHRASAASSAKTARRRSVVVLGFKNLSGRPDSAWLGSAFAELLSTELAAGDKLRMVPEEDVVRMKVELGLGDVDSVGRDTLEKIRRHLGVDLVVMGSFLAAGDQAGGTLRLNLRLADAVTGETLAETTETASEPELLELVGRAGAAMRAKLGIRGLTNQEETATRALLPTSPEAARLYAEGLNHLHRYEPLAAKSLLEQAIAIDPNLAMAHSALSAVYHGLGYDARSIEESRRAMELSANIPLRDRLKIEGQYYETIKEWPRSIELYQQLWRLFPDRAEYAMLLARGQILGGKAREAFQTLDAARKLIQSGPEQARLEITEAKAAEAVGDSKAQLAAARRAVEKARSLGSRYLEADGHLHQGNALVGADPAAARAEYERAKDLYIALGARVGLGYTLTNLGNIVYEQGDLAGARAYYEQALGLVRELGDREHIAVNLNNLSAVVSDGGDYPQAKKLLAEAVSLRRQIDDKSGAASSLYNIALLEISEGDLAGAGKNVDEGLALSRQVHRRNQVAYGMMVLGEIRKLRGDATGARARFEEALVGWNEIENRAGAAETRLALADLQLREGNAAAAETGCREAVDLFAALHASEAERKGRVLLAQALAAQRKLPQARKELQAVTALGDKGIGIETRLSNEIGMAEILRSLGDAASARRRLEDVLGTARRLGFVRYQLEAEIELAGLLGDRARLSAAERQAAARGFGMFTRLR